MGGDRNADGDADGDEEPPPFRAVATYDVCVGRPTTCTSAPFASETEYTLTSEGYDINVECEVRSGPGDSYLVDFNIEVQGGDGPGLSGQDLEFQSTATSLIPVRGCDEFAVLEGGNEFPTSNCTSIDGGGCEVNIWLEGRTIWGEFRCQELVLPGNDNTVMSTIDSASVGWGQFAIENCRMRV